MDVVIRTSKQAAAVAMEGALWRILNIIMVVYHDVAHCAAAGHRNCNDGDGDDDDDDCNRKNASIAKIIATGLTSSRAQLKLFSSSVFALSSSSLLLAFLLLHISA